MTTIPSAEDVKTGNSSSNYRFADGQIVTGRAEDGTLKPVPRLVGLLKRVGVHTGQLDDGRTYSKLECDLETNTGIVHLGANMTSMMATLTFGEGLLACEKDELIAIDAGRSKEKNRYGSFTTYANVYHLDEKTLQTKTARERIGSKEITLSDAIDLLAERLSEHPAWGERPAREMEDDNSNGSFALLAEIRKAGRWADPEKYAMKYFAVCTQLDSEKREFRKWQDVPEAVIDQLSAKHAAGKVISALKDLPPAPKTAQADDDDYDPFADE